MGWLSIFIAIDTDAYIHTITVNISQCIHTGLRVIINYIMVILMNITITTKIKEYRC